MCWKNDRLMVFFSFLAIVRVNFCSQSQICNYWIIYESVLLSFRAPDLQFCWTYNPSQIEAPLPWGRFASKFGVGDGVWVVSWCQRSSGLFLAVIWWQRLLLGTHHSPGPKLVVLKVDCILALHSCFMDPTGLRTIIFLCYILVHYSSPTVAPVHFENKTSQRLFEAFAAYIYQASFQFWMKWKIPTLINPNFLLGKSIIFFLPSDMVHQR